VHFLKCAEKEINAWSAKRVTAQVTNANLIAPKMPRPFTDFVVTLAGELGGAVAVVLSLGGTPTSLSSAASPSTSPSSSSFIVLDCSCTGGRPPTLRCIARRDGGAAFVCSAALNAAVINQHVREP
jgi:hypothetical protein|tara:strand:- start:646 stop:1023 length:378 start_codon:yes stop_codon:yes gene_type:complete